MAKLSIAESSISVFIILIDEEGSLIKCAFDAIVITESFDVRGVKFANIVHVDTVEPDN